MKSVSVPRKKFIQNLHSSQPPRTLMARTCFVNAYELTYTTRCHRKVASRSRHGIRGKQQACVRVVHQERGLA
ncbi:hypothetical protein Mapa_002040 [Marchantia paleacea]|nr:hypothetical protein Mapa_002040 [Marchantia paleacea]